MSDQKHDCGSLKEEEDAKKEARALWLSIVKSHHE